MPKAKFYAVAVGREAPKIFDNWTECSASVSRYSNALFHSFRTQQEAERWLASKSAATAIHMAPRPTRAQKASADIKERHLPDLPEPPEPKIELSPEQNRILARVKEGKNVFFTGSAGTGKSVLLREIIKLRKLNDDNSSCRVAITASTGIAALNIGGVTLHSWAGIGLGKTPIKQFIGKIRGQSSFYSVWERWKEVETLIIDEISMIDGSLFDYLEQVARELRKCSLPFGGIQLVLCGDFCQLPPVPNKDDKGIPIPVKFAFEAQSWDSCIGAPMMLRKVFRQKDETFSTMLNEMRYGRMQESTIRIFKTLSRQVVYTDGIVPTEIYPTRREVSEANTSRLEQLSTERRAYEAEDSAGVDHRGQAMTREAVLRELDSLVVPRLLILKVGAQVMLIKNLVQGVLVNGSVGQVIRFDTISEARNSDIEIAKVEDVNKSKPYDNDMAEDLLKNEMKWPVVKFTNGEILVMSPVSFTVNNGDGETMRARRLQLPLILAWALSVHKSQGQTLDRVRVDLRRTFERGQAYVALSRATSMEHLQVLNFSPDKVMAHPRVLAWYGQGSNTTEDTVEDTDDDDLGSWNDDSHWM